MKSESVHVPMIGTKVALTMKDITGEPFVLRGQVMGEVFQEGYIDDWGAWSAYDDPACKPCMRFRFREQGRRSVLVIDLHRVLSVEVLHD